MSSASFSTGLIGGNFVIGDNRIISVSHSSGNNTAGQNLTLQSGQGTGTGTGGSIMFQTAPGGSSGNSVNDLATKLTVTTEGIQVAGTGSISGDLDVNSKFIVTASNGNTSVGGNLTVTGDLTVSGTSTTITSSTLEVNDKNIVIGNVSGPTNNTADGGGITLKANGDKTIIYTKDPDRWTSNIHWNIATGKEYQINGSSVLSSTALGSTVVGSSLTSVGTLTGLNVSGDATFDTTTLKVDSSNNRVGIGTTSPDTMLHLKSTGDVVLRLEADSDNSGENDNPLIHMSQDGGGTNNEFKIGMNGTSGTAFTDAIANTAYLCSPGNIHLQFGVAGAALMTMRYNTSNVGIGETNPSYKLDVNGTGRFTGALTANVTGNLTGSVLTASQTAITGVGTITTGTWSATTIAVAKGGTGQTTYTAGQLLIGNNSNGLTKSTLTAGSNVTVTNGNGSITIASTDTNTTYTGGTGITLSSTTFNLDTASASALGGVKVGTGLAIDGSGVLSSTSSGKWSGSTDIYYTSGDVGIGTTSPGAKLHIKNTDSNSLIRIEADRTSGSTNYEAGIEFWNNEGDTSTSTTTYPSSKIISGFDTGGWESCFIRFKTHHSTSNNLVDTMTIKGPNVGIGTTSPQSLLDIHKPHVSTGLYESDGVRFSTTSGSWNWSLGYIGGYHKAGSNNSASGFPGGILFKTKPANSSDDHNLTTTMVLNAAGDLGIGQTNPSYKLDVSGTGRFTGNLTADANLTVTGNLTVSGTTTTVNSTTMTVDDPIITLGGDTAPGSNDNKDRGVEFRYYSGSAKVGFMGWDDSAGSFVLLKDATNSSEVFSGTAAELKVGSLTIGSDTVSNLSSLLTTSSGLNNLSDVTVSSNQITFGTNDTTAILPSDDNGVDLGSTGKSFKDAHIQGVIYASTLNNGVSLTLPTADGSNGQFLKTNGSGTLSWGTASGGGGSSALNDLTDVSTSGAQSNYALVYNGSSWAPAAQSGSGNSSVEYYSAHIQNISDIIRYSGYTVTASSTYSVHYPAVYGFSHVDLDNDSVWISANNTYNSSGSYTGSESTNGYNGEWLQINFGKKVKVYSYSITAQRVSSTHYRAPGGFKMFGSNDGTSWTEVHVGSAALSDYSGDYNKTNEHTLSTPSTHQYFRLVVNSTAGSTVLTSIAYLSLKGTFEEPDLIKGAISANVVYQRMTETATLTVPGQGTVEIEGLRLTITPQSSSSKVELNYNIFHEESNHNLGFAVSRTVGGTETFFTSNHTSNGYADYTFMNTRDDDYGGSPKTITYSMIDEPNTTGVVIYKVYGKNRESGSQTYYINRTKDDTNDGFEHGISTSSVKEFSTFTHNIAEQKVQGRVLETIAGVCDGRSITVSSGTYTLPNISQVQALTTTFTDASGSVISYKPPPGTRQVIYKFTFTLGGDNDLHALSHHKLLVDNTEITNFRTDENGYYSVGQRTYVYVFEIGTSDSASEGKFSSWNTLKTIKIQSKDYSTSHDTKLHQTRYWDSTSPNFVFSIPKLEIQAIGEENLVYNLTNQYSITEGQTLETLAGVCDGRSVTVSSGVYTLENVTAEQTMSTTYADVTGSSISYKPPPGTRQVTYEFSCMMAQGGSATHSLGHFKLFVDGTEITKFRTSENGYYSPGRQIYFYVFEIGKTDSASDGKFSSWNTNKTIKIQYRNYHATVHGIKFHRTNWWDGAVSNQFSAPTLKIEAIGKGIIEGTIGNLYSSKVNMVKTTYSTQTTLTAPSSLPGVNVSGLNLSIKPTATDSVIELKFNLWYEALCDNMFRITRNIDGTDVLVTSATNIWEGGIDIPKHDSDTDSTPEVAKIRWYDEPNTTSTVTYKLWVNSSHTGASKTIYVNRSKENTGASQYENGVSTGVAIEHPQQTTLHNPRYNSVIEQEGQTLETLAGVCDGRSITVSSGTYTLQKVDAEQDLSTSYVDLTGSTIDYKPPPGTKQIIYKFHALVRRDGGNYMLFHSKCLVDGQECTNFRMMEHNYAAAHSFVVFYYVFNIGTKDEIASGNFLSWDTNKTIKISVREYGSSDTATFHQNQYWDGSGSDVFCAPRLEIQAIGRKSDTTFLNSFFNERKGQVLETLAGVCDGRTIEVDSGTYTLLDVTARQQLPTSATTVTGSTINYKPPSGTNQVIYTFYYQYSAVDTSRSIVHLNFFFDDTEVTIAKKSFDEAGYAENRHIYKIVLEINGTNDIANGKIASWDSLKKLHITGVSASSSHEAELHYQNHPMSSGQAFVAKPSLEIQAIGDAAIQNATVVAGNSMVHFQGYSNTFTVTNSIPYITGYEDAPTSGAGYTTGLPLLKNFGNCMNTSTGIFTAPHTGLYSINVVVHKHDNTTYGNVFLVIGDKSTAFGDIKENYDNTGASAVYHIDSGTEVYLKSQSGAYPTSVNLSITALQDQVPQAISARPGMVLETLTGVCDGRTITVSSGTYTLQNVIAKQDGTGTFVTLTGSSIDYKPPPGTKQVIYELKFHAGWDKEGGTTYFHFHQKFMFNNTEVSAFNETYETALARDGPAVMRAVIEIGGEDDISNGKVSSWDSLANLQVFVRQYDSSQSQDDEADFHWVYYWNGSSGSNYSFLMKPTLTITAIGDGPGIVPSTGMNMVHASDTVYKNPTISSFSKLDYEFSEMKLVIKPTATDSVIELKYNIFGDIGENICFRVTRNITGTDVLVVPASNHYEGALAVPSGRIETVSSPEVISFNWYDEPNTTSTVTYKLWIGASHNSTIDCHLNRSGNTPGNYMEAGVSTAAAIEYPKTARPLDTENALTIPPFVGATNKEKLYNQSGDLYFNGKQLSNEWYKNGGDLYRLGANVGIGKSSPAYKLDVTGDINFTGTLRQNGTVYGWSTSGDDINYTSGKVGIGTDSPTTVLTIKKPIDSSAYGAGTRMIDFKSYFPGYDETTVKASIYCGVSDYSSLNTQSGYMAFMTADSGTLSERMRIQKNGYVGINKTDPTTRLVVWGNVSSNNFTGYRYTSTGTSSSTGGSDYCMYTYGNVMVYGQIRVGSDRRIKENIMDVPDNDALVLLRNIPCRYYEHIDKVNMRPGKTIGFIAQEVKSVFPIAVSLKKDTIPNVYKIIQCEWTGNVMYSQELGTVSGVKYRFYVGNSENEEKEVEIVGSSDNTFTFKQQWNEVFCYGHEVEDFHALDKQKLFALNFSATQELDRQQQADKAKITSLETKVASLESELAAIKAHLGL